MSIFHTIELVSHMRLRIIEATEQCSLMFLVTLSFMGLGTVEGTFGIKD